MKSINNLIHEGGEYITAEGKVLSHNELVCKVSENLPEEGVLYDLADLFKVFSDSTRIRILYALAQSEMSVCCISELLNMTVSAISHQLRILKQSGLVKYRREGKTLFYSLADGHVLTIISEGLEHVTE